MRWVDELFVKPVPQDGHQWDGWRNRCRSQTNFGGCEIFLCGFCLKIFPHKDHEDLFVMWPPKNEIYTCFSANFWAYFSRILPGFLTNQNFWGYHFTQHPTTGKGAVYFRHESYVVSVFWLEARAALFPLLFFISWLNQSLWILYCAMWGAPLLKLPKMWSS